MPAFAAYTAGGILILLTIPSRVAGEKPLAIGRASLCANRRSEFEKSSQSARTT
jgi:hypothetical protein